MKKILSTPIDQMLPQMISLREVLAEAREMNLQEVSEFLAKNIQKSLLQPQNEPPVTSRTVPFHYTLR
jgi:hypothetical protein